MLMSSTKNTSCFPGGAPRTAFPRFLLSLLSRRSCKFLLLVCVGEQSAWGVGNTSVSHSPSARRSGVRSAQGPVPYPCPPWAGPLILPQGAHLRCRLPCPEAVHFSFNIQDSPSPESAKISKKAGQQIEGLGGAFARLGVGGGGGILPALFDGLSEMYRIFYFNYDSISVMILHLAGTCNLMFDRRPWS